LGEVKVIANCRLSIEVGKGKVMLGKPIDSLFLSKRIPKTSFLSFSLLYIRVGVPTFKRKYFTKLMPRMI
jgi:hypothetical protein